MYINVESRLVRSYICPFYEIPIYISFYNNKRFVCASKSDLKKKLLNDIEKKKEKDEYYKRY